MLVGEGVRGEVHTKDQSYIRQLFPLWLIMVQQISDHHSYFSRKCLTRLCPPMGLAEPKFFEYKCAHFSVMIGWAFKTKMSWEQMYLLCKFIKGYTEDLSSFDFL